MEDNNQIDKNPLNSLKGGNVEADPRHKRRVATEDELQRLLIVTFESKATYRDMTGYQWGMLYLTASITGFRAEKLSTLRAGDFDLAQEPPVIVLAVINAKNGQTAMRMHDTQRETPAILQAGVTRRKVLLLQGIEKD